MAEQKTCHAIALHNQYFASERIAFHSRSHVVLEFAEDRVTVHDHPVSGGTILSGRILYTYCFDTVAERNARSSPRTVWVTGIVSEFMRFLLIKIRQSGKEAECTLCGKVWLNAAKSDAEQQQHLAGHIEDISREDAQR